MKESSDASEEWGLTESDGKKGAKIWPRLEWRGVMCMHANGEQTEFRAMKKTGEKGQESPSTRQITISNCRR